MDNWEEGQIKLLSLGGNQRLKYLLLEYSIAQNTDPNYKYYIYVTDYYRRLLRWEADGGEKTGKKEPVKPDALLGLECYKPIVQVNNQNVSNTSQNNNTNPTQMKQNCPEQQNQPPKEKGFFSEIEDMINQTGSDIQSAFNTMNTNEVNDSLKDFGTETKSAFENFSKETETFFSNFADDTKNV